MGAPGSSRGGGSSRWLGRSLALPDSQHTLSHMLAAHRTTAIKQASQTAWNHPLGTRIRPRKESASAAKKDLRNPRTFQHIVEGYEIFRERYWEKPCPHGRKHGRGGGAKSAYYGGRCWSASARLEENIRRIGSKYTRKRPWVEGSVNRAGESPRSSIPSPLEGEGQDGG